MSENENVAVAAKATSKKSAEEPGPVAVAFGKLLEALVVALTALTPVAAKVLEAGAESLLIQAKANAEVSLIRAGVEKIQAETEKRRAELVAPIETEAMVAKAEAMRSVQQLEAKKAAHELLNWVGRSAPKQAA